MKLRKSLAVTLAACICLFVLPLFLRRILPRRDAQGAAALFGAAGGELNGFSGDSYVDLENGHKVQVANLRSGDRVESLGSEGGLTFSDLVFFVQAVDGPEHGPPAPMVIIEYVMGNADTSTLASYLSREGKSGKKDDNLGPIRRVTVSPDHLVPSPMAAEFDWRRDVEDRSAGTAGFPSMNLDELVPAGLLLPGDRLWVADSEGGGSTFSQAVVLSVTEGPHATRYYVPETMTGSIVVDGVLFSTTSRSHEACRKWYWPVRWLYTMRPALFTAYPRQGTGLHWYVRLFIWLGVIPAPSRLETLEDSAFFLARGMGFHAKELERRLGTYFDGVADRRTRMHWAVKQDPTFSVSQMSEASTEYGANAEPEEEEEEEWRIKTSR